MRLCIRLTLVVLLSIPAWVLAQAPTGASPAPPSERQSLASTLNVYVFPSGGQDAAQQSRDEGECYDWAVQNSGIDPFALQKQAQQQQQQAGQAQEQIAQSSRGAGLKGAAKGAAGGAIVGEIADDKPGEGAAIGGAVGAIASRRKAKTSQEQATKQVEAQSQQTQQATAGQMENFRKAFSLCLEAKKYMVKY